MMDYTKGLAWNFFKIFRIYFHGEVRVLKFKSSILQNSNLKLQEMRFLWIKNTIQKFPLARVWEAVVETILPAGFCTLYESNFYITYS